jgi:hypothetical protein
MLWASFPAKVLVRRIRQQYPFVFETWHHRSPDTWVFCRLFVSKPDLEIIVPQPTRPMSFETVKAQLK